MLAQKKCILVSNKKLFHICSADLARVSILPVMSNNFKLLGLLKSVL